MPARFEQQGICFDFPETWEVEASTETTADLSVTVSSDGTAFWSLSQYPGSVSPEELLAEVLTAMQDEYPNLEAEEAQEKLEDQTMVGYDLSFFYLDLCNSATIRGFRVGDSSYLLLQQAEDHELGQAEPVFRAMTISMLRHARQQALNGPVL